MNAPSPLSPSIASGAAAYSRVASGIACVAVLGLEWAGQRGLRPGVAATFDQLGEPSSHHRLLYDVFGFCLPGALLVVFGLWLRRVLGRGWLSAGSCAMLSVLGASTILLGIFPYGTNSELLELLRLVARTLFVCSPAAIAVLVGAALARRRERSQALFSILCSIPMVGLVGWLVAVPPISAFYNTAPLVAATPWYAGTAAWLLQEPILVGTRRRAASAPFVGVRVLALASVLVLTASLTDILFPLLPTAIQVAILMVVAVLGLGLFWLLAAYLAYLRFQWFRRVARWRLARDERIMRAPVPTNRIARLKRQLERWAIQRRLRI